MSLLLQLFNVYNIGASGGSVVLSDRSSIHANPAGICHAGIAFSADGIVYDVGPTLGDRTQFASGQWYSGEPSAGIGSSYEVRCASLVSSSGGWDVQAAAVGTWVDISVERVWRDTVVGMEAPAIDTCHAVFEIRPAGGGSVLATATYYVQTSN